MESKIFDFREYRDLIRRKVGELNDKDGNWKWSVKAVNKHEVRIGWGYLDYIGNECFKIRVEDWSEKAFGEDSEYVVILRAFDARGIEDSYGEDFYNEFVRHVGLEFVEVPFDKAIERAIDNIGYAAFTRY